MGIYMFLLCLIVLFYVEWKRKSQNKLIKKRMDKSIVDIQSQLNLITEMLGNSEEVEASSGHHAKDLKSQRMILTEKKTTKNGGVDVL